MSNLSEYEKKRLENIKQNEALLRELEIPTVPKSRSSTPTVNSKLRKHAPKVKKEPQVATRVSRRLRGKEPDLDSKRPLPDDLYTIENAKKLKTIDILDDDDKSRLLGAMKDALKAMPNTEPVVVKKEDSIASDRALRERMENLKIQHEWTTVKVTPNRINGCLFHPSNTKLLGCAIDTEGYLGIWDIKEVQDDGEPSVYQYKPHTRTITDLHFNPVDQSKLITSSYDGLVRRYDMNKAEFETLDLGSTKYPITCFDITQDGGAIYFSTSDGEVGICDPRVNDTPIVYTAREKKIGCLHLNPVHPHLLATASNDRTATIWDVRMWDHKKDLSVGEPLQSIEHGYSVTSCYWSPNGDILATTSYDDYIRLFDLNKDNKSLDLKSAIKHNNHTGRWVTNFRARWNTNQYNGRDYQHLIIGNMKQTIDIYSGETGEEIVQLYDADHITAIPSVCQFHPNTQEPVILAGNASGRMTFWS